MTSASDQIQVFQEILNEESDGGAEAARCSILPTRIPAGRGQGLATWAG